MGYILLIVNMVFGVHVLINLRKNLLNILYILKTINKIYFENLKSDFIKPVRHPDYFDVFHIFNIRHPQRNLLKQFLLDHGIKTEIHYPLSPNKQKAMAEILSNQPCPISEEIHATTLSLPISYFHTKEDVERVCEVMNRF